MGTVQKNYLGAVRPPTVNRALRALIALGVAPFTMAFAFVVAPDPTGTLPLVIGLATSAVAVPAAYLAIARSERG
ncbi:hypothetical protein Hbl1158_05760 [Halobaculum sp. CBA1158]|uniref:hypothetical protein n=1 Tax=Halobaculum sp. CBA1158 TaxID=2904243 RepID=UPI001F193F9A|nr:hypothetical protein [Halobaculum sp. CBA1158]UIP00862.1 hypothetical protein Hbl1158_05760 [Halobaculum sp. CBA1158]